MSDLSEYVNPEPPPEITKIKNEDLIGETLFSKTWLCELLLKLIKVKAKYEYYILNLPL